MRIIAIGLIVSFAFTSPDIAREKHLKVKSYRNVHANRIQSPREATAQCGNGNVSFSENDEGTCSHHGGVRKKFEKTE